MLLGLASTPTGAGAVFSAKSFFWLNKLSAGLYLGVQGMFFSVRALLRLGVFHSQSHVFASTKLRRACIWASRAFAFRCGHFCVSACSHAQNWFFFFAFANFRRACIWASRACLFGCGLCLDVLRTVRPPSTSHARGRNLSKRLPPGFVVVAPILWVFLR